MNALGTATARVAITTGEAAKVLGVSRARVRELVAAGHLSRRQLPGSWPTFDLEEVERLAERYTRKATA